MWINRSFSAIVLLLLGVSTQAQGDLIDKIAAVVGNEIILKSEVELGSLQMTQGQPVTDEVRAINLENLMFEKLLLNQARIDSVEVSEAEIQGEIEQRLNYYISLLGSEEAFETYYGKSVPAWKDEFRDPIEEQLRADMVKRQLFSNVSITPGEVTEFYEEIPLDSLPLIQEEIRYSQISIEPIIPDSEWDATRTFLDSIRTVVSTDTTRWGLEVIKHTQDPGSKFTRGCYPLTQKGQFVPEYEAAVFSTPIGKFSEVFRSDFGYHFVWVKDRRGNVYESCHILMRPEVSEEAVDRARIQLDSLVTEIRTDTLTFKAAARLYSDDEKTANQEGRVINPANGSSRFQVDQIDPKLFFILDRLEKDEISDSFLYEQQDGSATYISLKMDGRKAAHTANLEDDYLIFQNQAQSAKQELQLQEWVRKRLRRTYVRIEPEYADFDYTFPWLDFQVPEANGKP